MEEFAGATGNWHDGVFFTEGIMRGGSPIGDHIEVEISRQNSNLTEVKTEMARQAKARGANVIQNFRYGQKAHQWWNSSLRSNGTQKAGMVRETLLIFDKRAAS